MGDFVYDQDTQEDKSLPFLNYYQFENGGVVYKG